MAGIRLKADEDGVRTMNAFADSIENGAQNINDLTNSFLEEIQEYPALGPHKQSIVNIITRIQEETNNTTDSARVVAEKFRKKAKEYRDWIDNDLFGEGSGK